MAKPKGNKSETAVDLYSYFLDKNSFKEWISTGEDNSYGIGLAMKMLSVALERELTDIQKEYLTLYIIDKMPMKEIAEIYSVNVSTVSRTIKRAKTRVFNCLRYCDSRLLNAQIPKRSSRMLHI